MRHATNSQGLTWAEWRAAATLARGSRPLPPAHVMVRDWCNGVDPTEYAHGA